MNDAATIAFWLAVVLAVSGSVAVFWRAWKQWLDDERRRNAIAEGVAERLKQRAKEKKPAFDLICDDAMETETRRAVDRAQARRPKSFGPYQG